MTLLDREGKRTSLIVVLLLVSFLLTALMLLRAQGAARYHQATVMKVISDWTRLAADEFARRADAQAGFYGTYPMLQSIVSMPEVPTRASLEASAGTDEGRRSASLVAAAFRFDPRNGKLVAPEASPAVREWLGAQMRAIAANIPPPADRKPLHATIEGTSRTFVYMIPPDRGAVSGFEVNRLALSPFFELVLETRPLMPPSLAEGRITNDSIAVRVVSESGRLLFHAGEYDPDMAVRKSIDEGLLQGMTVEASIDPAVAPLLVFGGVPRQELPIYALTLFVTAGLLAVAVLQLRRERALTRLRSEFVSSVSHELRTPLTQIRMFAETLLLDRVRSEEERQRSLTIIDQETRRLAQLVENVLQFSRGERGTLEVTARKADVSVLVSETVDAFLPIATARGVTISTTFADEATAAVDDDAFRQIVLNLLDNAVKYGPANQNVMVGVERGVGAVRVVVEDEGPGVPAKERKRIWRRYERLDRERERAIAGAGIGLAVVWELVAKHRGRVWVEDGGRGGARFVVELPAEERS